MQLTQIAALLIAVTGVVATPAAKAMDMEPFHLYARSCGAGLLKGKALAVCQQACKIACNVIPVPVASAACAASCNRKRSVGQEEPEIDETDADAAELEARDESLAPGPETIAALEAALDTRDESSAEVFAKAAGLDTRSPTPLSAGQVCRGACAVTCNSTVLALVQKKCLSVCAISQILTTFGSIGDDYDN
ncbi:hypothetical protein PG995_006421 [Apiospora arundinis]